MPVRRLAISTVLFAIAVTCALYFLWSDEAPPPSSPPTDAPAIVASIPVDPPSEPPRRNEPLPEKPTEPVTITQEFTISWLGDEKERPLDLQVRSLDGALVEEHREIRERLELSLSPGEYAFSFSDGQWERYRENFVFAESRNNVIEIVPAIGFVDVVIAGRELIGHPVTLTWGDDPESTFEARVGERVQIESRWGIRALDLQCEFGPRNEIRKTAMVLPSGAEPVVFELRPLRRVRVRFEPPLDDDCLVRVDLQFKKSWDSDITSRPKHHPRVTFASTHTDRSREVPPGTYTLTAFRELGDCVIDVPREVFVDPDVQETEVVIPQSNSGLSISGTVFHSDGGPAPNIAVIATTNDGREGHARYSMRTNSMGRFELENAVDGPHRISVLHAEEGMIRLPSPASGLEFTLRRIETANITITDIPAEIEKISRVVTTPGSTWDDTFAPNAQRSVSISFPRNQRKWRFFTLRCYGENLELRRLLEIDDLVAQDWHVKYDALPLLRTEPRTPSNANE